MAPSCGGCDKSAGASEIFCGGGGGRIAGRLEGAAANGLPQPACGQTCAVSATGRWQAGQVFIYGSNYPPPQPFA